MVKMLIVEEKILLVHDWHLISSLQREYVHSSKHVKAKNLILLTTLLQNNFASVIKH